MEQQDKCTSNYLICTDSLSAAMSIDQACSPNPAMQRLQTIIHDLATSNIKVSVLWIPGHSNIKGNMKADAAARRASAGTQTLIPLPFTDFIPHIREASLQNWKHRWRNTNTHLRKLHDTPKKWKKLDITRKQSVVLNRLRLGHTRLTHGHLMDNNLPFRPPCPWCHNVILSIEHLLLNCTAIEQERAFAFSSQRKPLSLSSLLGDTCKPTFLFDFLETLGIFNEI